MPNPNTPAYLGFDQFAGGAVLNAESLAGIINAAAGQPQSDLAAAIAALLGVVPEELVGDSIKVSPVTAAALAGAAAANGATALITSEALTTAAGSIYTLTLTDTYIKADSVVLAMVELGSSTTGIPQVVDTKVTAGQVVVRVKNIDGAAAFNGTIKVGVFVLLGPAE